MVCGTTSDAGKSHFVSGLCRMLARRGVKVAPFKAQNMALNSYVTPEGHEIGRAQAVQALAAMTVPEAAMNPILLKPTGERSCQVVVNGEPLGHMSAAAYHELKPMLLGSVMDALTELRSRFDVVILEGAGSPTEINLLDHDIVNLRVAGEAGLRAIVVGDIDRGGVFASLYGTVELLPPRYRELVAGFVVNKFRGDPALLADGLRELERRCGVPTLGVLPFVHDVSLDAEDSLALSGPRPLPLVTPAAGSDILDVAVVQLPRISNFTDLDALSIEPCVSVRMIRDAGGLADPDLIVIPGTKATVADLEWLRARGFDREIAVRRKGGSSVIGICGGYQMLGRRIFDAIESGRGDVDGLGWLDVETVFCETKITRQRRGHGLGERVSGYEIHHGRTTRGLSARPWLHLDDLYGEEEEGAGTPGDESVRGTNLHGLFEEDAFRSTFLCEIAARRRKHFVASGASFAAARDDQLERLADLVEAHTEVGSLEDLIAAGAK